MKPVRHTVAAMVSACLFTARGGGGSSETTAPASTTIVTATAAVVQIEGCLRESTP